MPVPAIAPIWLQVEPMIRPALSGGDTTVDVLNQLFAQDAHLWMAHRQGKPIGAVVTQIVTEQGRRMCNIWALGGADLKDWFHYLATIEAWAKAQGCAAVTVEQGRPGWQRLMAGYRITSVSLEKEL